MGVLYGLTHLSFLLFIQTNASVAIAATFKESMLIVSEDDGAVVVAVVLSNSSSTDLTVVVLSSSKTACGEH